MINIPGMAPKKRPLAESYVNTGAAGVLAVMKMLETFAALLGIVMLVFVSDMMTQTIRTFGNNESLYASLGSMKILVWILFFANLLILLFYCNFHNDICTVLHAVSQERKLVNPVKVGRNHLAGRSSCFAAGAGCYFLLSAFGFILPLLTNTKLISDEKLGQYTDIPAMVLLGINLFISLITFAKYLSLSICAGKFKKLHKK